MAPMGKGPFSLCRRRLTLAPILAVGRRSPATRSRRARASSMRAAAWRRSRFCASAVSIRRFSTGSPRLDHQWATSADAVWLANGRVQPSPISTDGGFW